MGHPEGWLCGSHPLRPPQIFWLCRPVSRWLVVGEQSQLFPPCTPSPHPAWLLWVHQWKLHLMAGGPQAALPPGKWVRPWRLSREGCGVAGKIHHLAVPKPPWRFFGGTLGLSQEELVVQGALPVFCRPPGVALSSHACRRECCCLNLEACHWSTAVALTEASSTCIDVAHAAFPTPPAVAGATHPCLGCYILWTPWWHWPTPLSPRWHLLGKAEHSPLFSVTTYGDPRCSGAASMGGDDWYASTVSVMTLPIPRCLRNNPMEGMLSDRGWSHCGVIAKG